MFGQHLSAYWELTKPRITALVLITTAFGFFMGGMGIHSYPLFFLTLLGTALVVGGSAVLNHYLERDVDRLMKRTRKRPLPAGLIRAEHAMSYGFVLVLAGVMVLLLSAGLLTAFLALLSAFLYVVVYTPLKRMTWLNTSLGAIPGALPPVGGWAAATGELDWGAGALFLILFAWQHPHFYSIAWIFREDYRRGGFKMLPVMEEDGRRTVRHIIGFSVALIGASTLPTFLGLAGQLYLGGAILLGAGMLAAGIGLALSRSHLNARRLLRASIVYLPLLLVLSVVDVTF
jgi:heme o synthase